ncbi:MAG: FmdB family zinc ribbon protein [Dehalococcoidales bacterium]
MPIYEYECEKCSLRFELKRRFSEDGGGFCPQCGSEARRLFSPVPIIFKGSGFYVTDSRKDHRRFSDKGDGGRSDGEKKSETEKL